MANKRIDQPTGTETVGHEWDGIEELNTPLPRWWLWTFYATIVFAAVTRNTAVPPLTGMTSMPVTGTASNLLMPQIVPAKAVPQALAADRA